MQQVTVEKVLSIVNAHIKDVNLTCENLNDNLSDLGMDSITFIQIIVALEEEFECEIPDLKLSISEMGTVNKLLEVLQDLFQENEKLF